MEFISLKAAIILFTAAMLAGAVNSVAGGGTLLTFPALFAVLDHNGIVANATSTVALWPGQLSSLFGYRKEIGQNRGTIVQMVIPSLIGGGIGAILLLNTPNGTFAKIVPYLILTATLLFTIQEPVSRYNKRRAEQKAAAQSTQLEATAAMYYSPEPTEAPASEQDGEERPRFRTAQVMLFQLLVAIYGGYFGAGIGILMLAALGFLGYTNIHRMNAIKNINGICINAVAITLFIFRHTKPGNGVGANHDHLIHWPLAAIMTVGSIFGGYFGAGAARKVGQKNVRRIIIGIGFALTLSLIFFK